MKLVTAIIQPSKLNEVKTALTDIGVCGMTITDVKGFGVQRGHTELYRGTEYKVDFLPKIKLEIATIDAECDKIVNAIMSSAKNDENKVGDGKIFVSDINQTIRIRTGQTGRDALVGGDDGK